MRLRSACSLGSGWGSGRPHGWRACSSSVLKLRLSLVVFLAASLADWRLIYAWRRLGTGSPPARDANLLPGCRRDKMTMISRAVMARRQVPLDQNS